MKVCTMSVQNLIPTGAMVTDLKCTMWRSLAQIDLELGCACTQQYNALACLFLACVAVRVQAQNQLFMF